VSGERLIRFHRLRPADDQWQLVGTGRAAGGESADDAFRTWAERMSITSGLYLAIRDDVCPGDNRIHRRDVAVCVVEVRPQVRVVEP
jgi:hypothetical protein